MADANRLFIDDAMVALLEAEERMGNLEQDVRTYRELLSLALTELHSEKQLSRRLMSRLERTKEPRRG